MKKTVLVSGSASSKICGCQICPSSLQVYKVYEAATLSKYFSHDNCKLIEELFKRYMDDGFLQWHSAMDLNALKNVLNNLHPNIKFIVESTKFDNFSKTLPINFLGITVLLHENDYVETVLGKYPRGKLPPNPKTNPDPNPSRRTIFLGCSCLVAPNLKTNLDPNRKPNRGAIFLGGNCPHIRSNRYIL